MNCQYCGNEAKLVPGSRIYPHRKDLYSKKFWLCKPCDAYVGTHDNSEDYKPLGNMANKELRKLRSEAHSLFDPLWKNGDMTRSQAYNWLSNKLGIKKESCHISWFSKDTMLKAIEIIKNRKAND